MNRRTIRAAGACATAMAVALALAIDVDCRAPTEIVLALSTDIRCADLGGTTITVGRVGAEETSASTTGAASCTDSGDLGTLVVTPSGGRQDEIAVRVVAGLGRAADTCAPPDYGVGCVVVRRALHFLPQTPLRLEIPLRAICAGIACSTTETCVEGRCAPAAIDPSRCARGICDESALGPSHPPDAGPEADGAVPVDAGASDAAADGAAPSDPHTGDMSGLQAGSPWPMQRRNPRHTGQSHAVGPAKASVRWRVHLGGVFTGSAAIAADGTIYAPAGDGANVLYALDPATGATRWTFTMVGAATSTPAIAADGAIVVGGGSRIYRVSPGGFELWSVPSAGQIYGAPSIAPDGTTYAAGLDGIVYAVDKSGALLWQTPIAASAAAYPGATFDLDGSVYSGAFTPDGGLFVALSPDGGRRWQVPFGGSLFTPHAIGVDGTIYVASQDGQLSAVTPAGAVTWSVKLGLPGVNPAIADDGTIYFGNGEGQLLAVRPDGSVAWTFTVGGAIESSPIVDANGDVYFGADDGVFYAVNAAGQRRWSYAMAPDGGPTRVFSGAMAADGAIVVGDVDGSVVTFAK